MKKLLTITTLTAGLGATLISTSHQADAAEFQPSHQYSYQQQNFSQQAYQYHTTETNTTSTSTSTQSISTSSGNLYTAGQCTWYVFDRVDGKIGSTWGNANNWASAAQAAGYTVDHQPEEGAILQTSEGSYGHVAYVESVNRDGSVTISEMNYSNGPFSTDTRTISASQASAYNYIHLN